MKRGENCSGDGASIGKALAKQNSLQNLIFHLFPVTEKMDVNGYRMDIQWMPMDIQWMLMDIEWMLMDIEWILNGFSCSKLLPRARS